MVVKQDINDAHLSAGRSEDDLRDRVRTVILELAPNPSGLVSADPRLIEDLDYHSLALVELAFALEDEFDLQPIDAATAQAIRTVRDIEKLVVGQLRQRGAGSRSTSTPGRS